MACGDDGVVKKMESEVMALHDEVMPRMMDSQKLRKSLKNVADSLESLPAPDSTRIGEITAIVADMKTAEQGMMDWMRDYDPKKATGDKKEAMEYLDQQMKQIKQVKLDIEGGIERANTLIK
ncbi:MAG: hypothetical protein EAZ89_01400 [Bacteroidetes bacterium]|nr:MAG: hypothetical protein EAZ89_01400 [Bacteroidota bacterium]